MSDNKTDVSKQGDQELSVLIQNDEHLYELYEACVRKNRWNHLQMTLDELFIYTHEQLECVMEEFETDVNAE